MINSQFRQLLIKYTLLLSIFYFLSFLLKKVMIELESDDAAGDYIFSRSMGAFFLEVLINVLTAYIIGLDIKKFQIRTKYVILATLLYRPIGVVSFLLFILLQHRDQVKSNDKA